ncbi:MAG: DUF4846 domain-containing protein, partial [Bacteroidota bacterium]
MNSTPWEFMLFLAFFSAWWLKDLGKTTAALSVRTNQISTLTTIEPQGDPSRLSGRIAPPAGFERPDVIPNSFPAYLRDLPLKPVGSAVHYFDGQVKVRNVHVAVVDLDVGSRDLQQCADAVIRLQAEYLYEQKAFDQISFPFTNGFKAPYHKWRAGYRIQVSGNDVQWVKRTGVDESYRTFRKYLDMVFAYAGTISLDRTAYQITPDDLRIGDIFVESGSPGHAVLVVDVAVHPQSGAKKFLLAQSYMP